MKKKCIRCGGSFYEHGNPGQCRDCGLYVYHGLWPSGWRYHFISDKFEVMICAETTLVNEVSKGMYQETLKWQVSIPIAVSPKITNDGIEKLLVLL